MIIKVKVPQGVKVSGTLTKPGEHKTLGNKPVFILNVEAASEKRDGRWESYYVDVKIWGEHPEMEDMYQKGDYIEAECEIAGLPVRLYDTAGLRTGGDEIEDEGIRRARSLFEKADLIVYLVEPGRPLPDDIDPERTLIVHSKSDLACGGGLAVSSMTGEGVGLLIDKIGERLHEGEVVQGAEGPSIDSERQLACIRSCIQALEAARDNRNQSVDIMALFFQGALEQLGLITGEVTNEELLDTLFSKFCLGK